MTILDQISATINLMYRLFLDSPAVGSSPTFNAQLAGTDAVTTH